MLRHVVRSALRLAPEAAQANGTGATAAVRGMASGGLTGFKENEKVIEDLYFTKEDQRMLGKLLNKVKHQSDATDKHGAEGQKTAELSALAAIVSKYKISTEDMQKLVAWKHSQY